MAHEITNKDVFGYHGQRAWHGLGMALPEHVHTAVDGFREIGLDWEERLMPIYASLADGTRVECPEHRAHVRMDTGDVLGVVSEGYRSVSNLELAQFADSLAGEDAVARIETAGSLFGGKRVYALLKMPAFALNRGDEVAPYILVSNGHGGSASFNCYPTSVRVVCNNTLTASERDISKGVRFYHTGSIEEKLKAARVVMGSAKAELARFQEQCVALSNTDLSSGQMRDFMLMAYSATFGKEPTDIGLAEKWLRKREEIVNDWLLRADSEKQTQFGGGGTVWAALNAVTEWNDHARGGTWMKNKGADSRINSNLFGTSAATKRAVFARALELV